MIRFLKKAYPSLGLFSFATATEATLELVSLKKYRESHLTISYLRTQYHSRPKSQEINFSSITNNSV